MVFKYFTRDEFACKCGCGFNTVDAELLDILETARRKFGPIIINSGCRCTQHNRNSGGAASSRHIVGKAADIRSNIVSSKELAEYFRTEYPGKYGIGEYGRWVHIDVRSNKARWRK